MNEKELCKKIKLIIQINQTIKNNLTVLGNFFHKHNHHYHFNQLFQKNNLKSQYNKEILLNILKSI